MLNPRVLQIAALLAVIFASGLAIGVVLAPRLQTPAANAPRPATLTMEQKMEERLTEFTKRLKLTPPQQESIRELWRTHASEMQRLNAIRRRRGREVFEKTSAQVRQVLTPEQQSEYDRLLEENGKDAGNSRTNARPNER